MQMQRIDRALHRPAPAINLVSTSKKHTSARTVDCDTGELIGSLNIWPISLSEASTSSNTLSSSNDKHHKHPHVPRVFVALAHGDAHGLAQIKRPTDIPEFASHNREDCQGMFTFGPGVVVYVFPSPKEREWFDFVVIAPQQSMRSFAELVFRWTHVSEDPHHHHHHHNHHQPEAANSDLRAKAESLQFELRPYSANNKVLSKAESNVVASMTPLSLRIYNAVWDLPELPVGRTILPRRMDEFITTSCAWIIQHARRLVSNGQASPEYAWDCRWNVQLSRDEYEALVKEFTAPAVKTRNKETRRSSSDSSNERPDGADGIKRRGRSVTESSYKPNVEEPNFNGGTMTSWVNYYVQKLTNVLG